MRFSLRTKRVFRILLFNALLHVCPIYEVIAVTGTMATNLYYRYYVSTMMGVFFLVFPFIGWVGEMIQRYKVMMCGLLLILFGYCGGIIISGLWAFDHDHDKGSLAYICEDVYLVVSLVAGMIGFGIMEANSLRLGTDQLPDDSSNQIHRFIQLFYATKITPLIVVYICIAAAISIFKIEKLIENSKTYFEITFVLTIVNLCLVFLSLLLFVRAIKIKVLEVHKYQGNPFKKLIQILRYSWQHKYPQCRSAFTYWEEDIPARIDFGKEKYGGPFANEEVEGVKSFFQILVLLLTLFGYQLAGDTFSVSEFIKQYGCPTSDVAILLIGLNPQQVCNIVIIIIIPILQLSESHRNKYPLLKKLAIGLFFALAQELASIIIGVSIGENFKDNFANFTLIDNKSTNIKFIDTSINHISLLGCYILNSTDFLKPTCKSVDGYYWWLVLPQVLSGLVQVFVFMTALEFICAQAPYSLQGVLTGFWFSTYFINYVIVGSLDTFIAGKQARQPWYIYHCTKLALIFLSLLLYCCVASHYRYRERNEVVNERQMIEEICERNIDRREEYERAQRELLIQSVSVMYGTV